MTASKDNERTLLLENATFEDDVFDELDLASADLSEKEFVRCTFRKSSLMATVMHGAVLEDCVFDRCDLSRMRPASMSARGVEYLHCRLAGVDWTGVRPNPTLAFEQCNLEYSSFIEVNLTGTRFSRCRLSDVQFVDVRLTGADFSDSDMAICRFQGCDLRDANFSGTTGLFIDPAKNKVKGARIAAASAVLLAEAFGFTVD